MPVRPDLARRFRRREFLALRPLAGLVLGGTVSKKWLVLPAVAAFFLAQQALQGWSLPFLLVRKTRVRTRLEISSERYALKMLRGDFGQRVLDADLAWEAVRKT